MANSTEPDQTQIIRRLVWVYTVCKGLSVSILSVIMVDAVPAFNLFFFYCYIKQLFPSITEVLVMSTHNI